MLVSKLETQEILIQYGYLDIMVFFGAMGALIKFVLGIFGSAFFFVHLNSFV
jgi:hypothetical protein